MSNNKYCISCGARLSVDDKICRWCGSEPDKPKNIYAKNKANNKKVLLISVVIFIFISVIVFCTVKYEGGTLHYGTDSKENNKVDSDKVINKPVLDYTNLNKIDYKIRDKFIIACKEINMNPENIKSVEKLVDWNSGPRYSFVYESNKFTLYAYDSGDISSINVGTIGEKVYDERYKSLDVNDFLVNMGTIYDLQFKVEEMVKLYANYPNTINFDWFTTGGYSRKYEFYFLNVNFSAENAYGVRTDHVVTAEFAVNDSSYTINCLTIDSSIVYGKSKYKKIERIERELLDESTEDKIILKYGVKGNYGKEDLINGKKYIRYYVPEGTYEIKALTKNANIMIESVKLHKENGFDTPTLVENIKLSEVNDVTTFTIKSSQCITVVMNTKVELTLKD